VVAADDVDVAVGLRRGTVRVDPYTELWPAEFERERERLDARLGSRLLAIEHIGSTSIPGLPAKPLIDMQAAVESLDQVNDILMVLRTLGYAVMPERVYLDRVFLPKGPEQRRTHHLNLVLLDSDRWREPLMFRDRLRSDPVLRDEYAALKSRLAVEHPHDRDAYTDGKAGFIGAVLEGC
jgi:GrpB-like predicted nucleotidyltransferase (UPF0157 family)